MSNECSTIVWKRDFGSANRKVIAARLADHADDEGRGIWPSVERIAAQCNVSERTVQRVLSSFVGEGVLIMVDEGGRGPRTPRRYDFDMGRIEALPLAKWGPADTGNKGDTVSPLETPKGDSQSDKGDNGDEKGCHGDTQTIIEPSEEPSTARAGARERGEISEDPETDDPKRIERDGWALLRNWPGFDGMPKEPAMKVWKRLGADEREAARRRFLPWLELLRRQKKSHIPAPSTYLTERLWAAVDDPDERPQALEAKPFGKLWQAARLALLLAPPTGPTPRLTAFERTMVDDGKADEAELMRDKHARTGWPAVNAMHERAAFGRGETVAPHLDRLAGTMEPVRAGSERFEEWRLEHRLRGWPWLPDMGRAEWVYFPAGGPGGLKAFEQQAVSAGGGNGDAGNQPDTGTPDDAGGRKAAE